MPAATRSSISVLPVRLLAAILILSPHLQPQQRVDLTQVRETPGPSTTGGKLSSAVKPVDLPLEITLDRLWPLSITWLDPIEADVTLRNVGKETLMIPVSRDLANIQRPGNADIKTMHVLLRLTPVTRSESAAAVEDIIGAAASSTSVPGSYVLLPANGTLSIHLKGPLPESVKAWRDRSQVLQVRAQAVYGEHYFDSADLFMWNASTSVVSTNTADFTLAWPPR